VAILDEPIALLNLAVLKKKKERMTFSFFVI
jgi:hypothetical protein